MKLFSRKALIASATAVAVAFGGVSVASAQDKTYNAVTAETNNTTTDAEAVAAAQKAAEDAKAAETAAAKAAEDAKAAEKGNVADAQDAVRKAKDAVAAAKTAVAAAEKAAEETEEEAADTYVTSAKESQTNAEKFLEAAQASLEAAKEAVNDTDSDDKKAEGSSIDDMEPKDIRDWIAVFTAVIGALGTLLAFLGKYFDLPF